MSSGGAPDVPGFVPLSPADKGHPALGWALSEHRDYSVFSGGLSSSCLSSRKEELHSSRATPQIRAGNKATLGLILPDGPGSGRDFQAQFRIIRAGGCHRISLRAVHACWAGAGAQPPPGLFPGTGRCREAAAAPR